MNEATVGKPTPPVSWTYTWQYKQGNGAWISLNNQNALKYTPQGDLVGAVLRLEASARFNSYKSTEYSEQTTAVQAGMPMFDNPTLLSTSPVVGEVIIGKLPKQNNEKIVGHVNTHWTYQWQSNDNKGGNWVDIISAAGDITGGDGSFYKPNKNLVGHILRLEAKAKIDGKPVKLHSEQTQPIVDKTP